MSEVQRLLERLRDELSEDRIGFEWDSHDGGLWTCGTLLYGEGGFNYCGRGKTPEDAAQALIDDITESGRILAESKERQRRFPTWTMKFGEMRPRGET